MPEPRRRAGEKVAWETPPVADERLQQLRTLFPEAATEGKIDFDKLKALLGEAADDRPERYSFSWAGKRDAIRLLQTPSRATLKPCPEESIDWDTTRNVFIEGENLEVLKLLYKSYFGRVKMIYIDPPYNTGNDFIYPDDFADPLDTYLKLTGQKSAEGNLLTTNADTSGRYHSAWLSMMYPRLFLARQLLRDDGVIFVSIDDHEVHNLRMLMNEVFGEENFLAQLVWKSRQFPDARAVSRISTDHEYILAYARCDNTTFRGAERDESKYANPDNDARGLWMSRSLLGLATAEQRPNLHYSIVDTKTGTGYDPPPATGWRYSRKRMEEMIVEGRLIFPPTGKGRPREKKFRAELSSEYTSFPSIIDDVFTAHGTAEIRELFGFQAFDFPKPSKLIRRLIEQGAEDGDTVLDFFAGSCSTAHAAIIQSCARSARISFVCVQLPEPLEETSENRAMGLQTVADIAKERIRRVIAGARKEGARELQLEEQGNSRDLGFRVFNLDSSTSRPWVEPAEGAAPSGQEYAEQMALFTDPLLPGWRVPDVVWEVAVKEGYGLSSRIEEERRVNGATIHRVTDPDKGQSFRICLDDKLPLSVVKKLDLSKDELFVCRDVALDDESAANLALQCRLKTI